MPPRTWTKKPITPVKKRKLDKGDVKRVLPKFL